MTVQATTRRAGPSIGNGVATVFPFAFKVFLATDLQVVLQVLASGAQSVLVLNDPLGYTVALNADQNANPGGSVTYNPLGVPMPATQSLTITSVVPQVQGTHIINGGAFFANNVEDAVDKVLINLQDLTLNVGNSIRFPTSDSVALNAILPPAAARANQALLFDVSGNVVVGAVGNAPISSAWQPVVAAATLAAGRTAMGFSAYFDSLIAAATKAAFDALISPLTTKGDLWGFAAVDARVPVGANGKSLIADSLVANGVDWKTIFNDSTVTDVASAATCNIFAALTSVVKLTGTTDITTFDAAASLGQTRLVRVETTGGRLINGANLINCIPFDIQMMAGDWFIAVSMGGNTARIAKYQRGDGQVLLGGRVPFTALNYGVLNAGASATMYATPNGRTQVNAEIDGELIIPEACTLSELRLVSSAALAGGTAVATIRKNRASTTLTCTLAAASGTTASDVTHSVDFNEGDHLSLQLVTGAIGAITDFGFTLVLKKRGLQVGTPMQLAHNPYTRSVNGNTVAMWGAGTVLADHEWMPGPCSVQQTAPYMAASGTTGPWSGWNVMKNGVYSGVSTVPTAALAYALTAGTGSIPNPGARGPIHGFAESDLTCLRGDAVVTSSDWQYCMGVMQVTGASPVQYPPSQMLFHCNQQVQAATRFAGGYVGDSEPAAQSATETDVQIPMPACTMRSLRACAGSAPAAGQTITFTLRKNGVDTGLTCTITSAGRTASDLTNSVTFAAGDIATLKTITSATSGTRSCTASVEMNPL